MPAAKAKTLRPVYIVDGARTPFLKAKGPGAFYASDLAVAAGRPLLDRQHFSASEFDHVILGCTAPGADEANIGRVAALRLGCSESTPAYTVHRNCASGMQALDNGMLDIATGRADLILAGGTESMSHAPLLFSENFVRWLAKWYGAKTLPAKLAHITKFRLGLLAPVIGLLRGLTDPIVGLTMGQTAEIIAKRFGISRADMDAFAVQSHLRLAAAQTENLITEIVSIIDRNGQLYTHDDGVRPDSSIEKLAKLKPVFDRPVGKVTAGNSAQITDGACWLILASEAAVEKHQLEPIGMLTDIAWGALAPAEMGLGPVYATDKLLRNNSLTVSDIDYWEINEAFAGQVLACTKAMESEDYCREFLKRDSAMGSIANDRLNIHGGGVSLGHPVGATGARITLHTLHTLRQNNAKRGIATLCIGGGQGGAALVETIN